MKKTVFSILLFCSVFVAAVEATTQCSCVSTRKNITAYNEFLLADAVFAGKIVEIEKTPLDSKTGSYTEKVKFQVMRAWKQDLKKIVIITNEVRGCTNGFDENEEFLVYAYKKRGGTFGTFCCCSRTKSLSKADEDLKDFEKKGVKPTEILEESESNNRIK